MNSIYFMVADLCCQGHWCPEGTPSCTSYPCHAGSYNNRTGITAWEQCVDCPEGTYCPKASVLPTDCPAGTFRLHKKGENITYCEECWAGYYCPVDGTIEPSPCVKGKYSDVGATECTTCEAGYYCDTNATRYDYYSSMTQHFFLIS